MTIDVQRALESYLALPPQDQAKFRRLAGLQIAVRLVNEGRTAALFFDICQKLRDNPDLIRSDGKIRWKALRAMLKKQPGVASIIAGVKRIPSADRLARLYRAGLARQRLSSCTTTPVSATACHSAGARTD